MIPAANLPDTIPLFPLSGAIVVPRGRLPLNIFEPRYLAMLEDVLKTRERLIGVIQPVDKDPEGELHAIGCAGRITGFNEAKDGRYMITLTGVSRFRLQEQVEGFTPYLRGRIDWQGFARDLGGVEHITSFDRERFLDLLERFFTAQELESDWDNLTKAEPEMLINSLSMLAPFSPEDKQALLEAPTLADRRDTLVTLMEFVLRRVEGGGVMQ
ncbi:LON peptidase substrate-binding domain-containing protein [Profundibacter amoris]|uniref:ATP-dependent protease n=1 Tax=Profundibacter amoris TaxID=2171755 RepID=A0A347UJQ1_9RHOB|nr:LON peptidase substrate-binding domain-containing protein [Profundibacter amoris]AXX99079.1 ATP-dependent protease [Profundibacter amoris]